MATSGNFEKKIAGGSSGGYYVGVDWKVNSQSTSNVSSNITASVYIRATGNGYNISSSASKNISLTINGTKYTGTNTIGIGANTKKVLLSKTVDVKHNSDGSKSCAFEASVQIGFSLSGTSLSTVSVSGTGTFDKINVNSAPVMSGSLAVSPSGTIAENTSSISISWTKATDAQNNANKYVLERFINGRYDKSYEINNINTVSYTDNVSAFGEGTSIYYQIFAYDTFGAMSNGLQSAVITKNTLTGATLASNSSVSSSFSDIALSWSGAKNTNGNTAFKYDITANGLTVYNAANLTSTSATIKIATSSQNGPYILKNDLINAYKNSNFSGTLTFTLKTKNNFGSTKTSTKAISVDMRKAPTAATPAISEDASLSTALKTVPSTGNKYFIPNGTDKIRITWSGASDVLGQPLSYDVQVQLGGGSFETKVSNTTSTYYDLVLPKQTSSGQIVARVITKTSYNYTSSKDSPAKTLHYYNAPTCDVIKMDRTSSAATATIKLNANTSIPNINFTTRSYSGASSGTLTNTTAEQTISASGLTDTSTSSWTITFNDDTGFTASNQTKKVDIPTYTPLFSVREKGVGVNAIPDGSAGLIVKKGLKSDTVVASNYVQGKQVKAYNNDNYATVGCGGSDAYITNAKSGKYLQLKNDGTLQYDNKKVYHEGNKPTASAIGALATSGGTISGTISKAGTSQSWLNGAKGNGCLLNMTSQDGYSPMIRQKTTNGAWTFGAYLNNTYHLSYMTDTDINNGNNNVNTQYSFPVNGRYQNVLGFDGSGVINTNKLTLNTGSANATEGFKVRGSSGAELSLWGGTGGAVVMTTGNFNLHLGRNGSTTDMVFYDGNITANKLLIAKKGVMSTTLHYDTSGSGYGDAWGVGCQSHFYPTTTSRYIGVASYRWHSAYLTASPNVSSDRNLKENISYLNDKKRRDDLSATDFHKFIRDDLKIATYNYKLNTLEMNEEEERQAREMNTEQIGFIAQDIVNTKVGSRMITEDSEGVLGYETGNYTTIIAGALQEEIKLRDAQIDELKQENELLKQEIALIKEKLGL